ncbi:MAG TPA: DUF922 domain-containing protein, partial [Candidatus Limnocylindrales bacterium]|nr:DUF922 domain-containing protein [Candidatus Limnocylindrales bacterium]
ATPIASPEPTATATPIPSPEPSSSPAVLPPLPKRRTAGVPLFVGPATLELSGRDGTYRWREVHFGAHEVMVLAAVSAAGEPCLTRLTIDGVEGEDGLPLAGIETAATPGTTATSVATTWVDYATAPIRVDSTCPEWSLRLEPLADPNLPYSLTERFYPVRGESIAELAPQTNQARDGWAAYASWKTDWRSSWQDAGTSCDVTSGLTVLWASITYPKWHPPPDAAPRVVAQWQRFIKNLTTHELGHVTIALQGADAIDELFDKGFSAPTCDIVEDTANEAAMRVHERYKRLNDRYDRETDHGVTQGTTLP